MIKNYELSVEILAKKGEKLDLRCSNCGKKLCDIEKNQANSSKNVQTFLSIKCCRCGKINNFGIK